MVRLAGGEPCQILKSFRILILVVGIVDVDGVNGRIRLLGQCEHVTFGGATGIIPAVTDDDERLPLLSPCLYVLQCGNDSVVESCLAFRSSISKSRAQLIQ